MTGPLNKTVDRLLWSTNVGNRPLALRIVYKIAQHAYAVARDLVSGQLSLRAMSLVYTTLLSVVPLLAFSFSVLTGLGMQDSLEPQLVKILEPLGEKGAQITTGVIKTVKEVQGKVLGSFSLLFFIYTAIAMVQKIEGSFNYVWHVARPRSVSRRFTEYVSVLLIGPVVIVTALGMLSSLRSNALVETLAGMEPFGTTLILIGKVLPYLLVAAVFTFLYKFLPNARVRFRAALIGGIAAGVMWSTAGALFASFVADSTTRNLIYSAFALPITALIWLYVSWLILLIGAQIAFYVQNPSYLRIGRREPRLSNAQRERIALNAMFLIGNAFRVGTALPTTTSIAREICIPGVAVSPVLNRLERAGLLTSNEAGEFVPGREMARITLGEILASVRHGGETGSLLPPTWSEPVRNFAESLEHAIDGQTNAATLSDFLDSAESGAGDQAAEPSPAIVTPSISSEPH